ncbi:MAG: helicase-related protein, partial [Candidatus Binataceae bacterium]
KLAKLKTVLKQEGFFDNPAERLLIFTEFRDTLDYLVDKLKKWGFKVGFIHGGMPIGSRDEKGSRLHAEEQFREGVVQVLVATEAAGEGINLQCCHVLFNYDIPWNPNRLEQRMGRIHRYGQKHDCIIFNFVATNTVEGRIRDKLLEKIDEIRKALDDDAVFNVVGEILPAAQIERTLRDYYAGNLGDEDLEDRLLSPVSEDKFRAICQNALEGLATKKLNLEMLVERRARAQEHRLVPETIARFLTQAAPYVPMTLKPISKLLYTFDPAIIPQVLHRYENQPDWRLQRLANRYPRFSTERETAEKNSLEWVTPGHPLFEAIRRHVWTEAGDSLAQGACFYSLDVSAPLRLDFYRARVVDGLGDVIHERIFAVEVSEDSAAALRDPNALGNLNPAQAPEALPAIAGLAEPRGWLNEHALTPFLEEIRTERVAEVERIRRHVELSLTELIEKEDRLIGRFAEEAERSVEGAAGNLKQAEDRHAALMARRERRRQELERQASLTLQGVERITSAMVLPHPAREIPEVRNLRPDPETEAIAMRVAIEYEQAQRRVVTDVHEKDLGYDITSLDTNSGELRLIEIKGIAGDEGTVALTPNEKRTAEDRRDCYWLYVVTHCKRPEGPKLMQIGDPAQLDWDEIRKIDHYALPVKALAR